MATLHSALDLFQKKKRWGELMRKAMHQDFSWDRSAREYLDLYWKLVNEEGAIPARDDDSQVPLDV